MNIELRFFASVREALGVSQESLVLPQSIFTVGEVRAWLVARGGVWADALSEKRVLRMAYNQVMCEANAVISEGGEIAFFPPVTGG